MSMLSSTKVPLLFLSAVIVCCEAFLGCRHKVPLKERLPDFSPLHSAHSWIRIQSHQTLAPCRASLRSARSFACVKAKVCMSMINLVGSDFVGIQQGDVVKFPENEGHKSVGFVESLEEDGSAVLIRLVKREGLGSECYLDESQPKLRVKAIDCLLIDAYPSQRVAWSSASPHFNPHGCPCCMNSASD